MEQVKDVPGKIPTLALYPPQSIRQNLSPSTWTALLDTWLFCIEYRLRLKPEHFRHFKLAQNASGVPFLLSYLSDYEKRTEPLISGSKEAKLHHQCYILLKRLLTATDLPFNCSALDFFNLLGSGSAAFQAISDWRATLKLVWKRGETHVRTAIDVQKTTIVKAVSAQVDAHIAWFVRLSALMKCLPESAVIAVVGADYLEAIMNLYTAASTELQRAVTEHLYQGLRGFMFESSQRVSLLLDVLFDLKAGADSVQKVTPDQPTLLSSLLCTTSFMKHFRADSAVSAGKRGQSLVDTLSDYRQNCQHLHPPPSSPRKSAKGKAKARNNQSDDIHIHKASQISQIHDLFPDLPDGYVLRLLDHFSDEVEALIAALLEPDSLPDHLQKPSDEDAKTTLHVTNAPDLAPRSTPPPPTTARRTVFDGDDFDRLQISSTRLHKGRKEITNTLTVDEQSRSKAAILAALSAFDADDDERDDTYDVADVGGAVDNTLDSDEKRDHESANKSEEVLWQAWTTAPQLFDRDSATRISKARRQLCQDTNMDNEQIEGWAIMLKRDPKLEDRLRQKYSATATFQGNQRVVQSTRWQANASPSDSQDEAGGQTDGRRVGQAGIRGPRTWNRGRGRGGSTAGATDEKATQLARKRKEQGRGRGGAAHNRREGRAKKMGRGMGPVTTA